MRILIIGGYGIFGGRLIELLDNEPRLTLFVGGRSAAKAASFIASRTGAKARLMTAPFDRDGDLTAQLSTTEPDLVVDASGPFQNYGDRPYRVVEACLHQGANYLDLADGSDFVGGIGAFDRQARDAGLFILSGVSSFPVLTAAAARQLSAGMSTVTAIRGGIAPSPYAVVGENVIRAIASYAGQPVQRRRDGAMSAGYPFTEHLRYTIAPPGHPPLESRSFSLVDVPDLRALALLWPQAKDIWMGAAPVPEMLHRGLAGLAWNVRTVVALGEQRDRGCREDEIGQDDDRRGARDEGSVVAHVSHQHEEGDTCAGAKNSCGAEDVQIFDDVVSHGCGPRAAATPLGGLPSCISPRTPGWWGR
jgi:Saccharopine dehydrogenase NADP binding domain